MKSPANVCPTEPAPNTFNIKSLLICCAASGV